MARAERQAVIVYVCMYCRRQVDKPGYKPFGPAFDVLPENASSGPCIECLPRFAADWHMDAETVEKMRAKMKETP